MQLFTNNGSTTLANAVLVGDTTITVVDASKFPAGNFKVTLETIDRSVNEIVLVTGVAGNVLTVTRAQEGTTASEFAVGSKVEVRVTAEFLNNLQAKVDGLVDDTVVAVDKAYSSDKVLQLHNAQQEAIAHLSGASATFSSNVSQLVPEEPAAKVDIVWTNGQASSNASVLELGVNEVLFKVDGNYSFLTTLTLYRLSDGSVTTVTFELYDADTGTVLKSVSQAVDMIAGTKETLPLNVLVPITGASEANPVRMKVRMGMTAANGTLELFSFSSVLTAQAIANTFGQVFSQIEYTATQGQTTFPTSYTVGMIEVYLNGLKLDSTQYTATDGSSVVLVAGVDAGDRVTLVKFTSASVVPGTYNKYSYTATAGQTTFNATYTVGYVEVYRNGFKLAASDYTATDGTSVILASGAAVGDIIEIVAFGILNIADTYTKAQVDTGLAAKQDKVTVTGIAKWDGNGSASAAVAGTDYQAPLVSGTNIKTINSQSVVGAGDLIIAGVASHYQEFTASGTWTKPTGITWVYIEAWGGGGSGAATTNTTYKSPGGGGGGGFASKIVLASALTSTVTVTIGSGGSAVSCSSNQYGLSGGDSSFGAYLVANGGMGGDYFGNGGDSGGGARGAPSGTVNTSYFGEHGCSGGGGGGQSGQKGGTATYGGGGGGGLSGGLAGSRGQSVYGGSGGDAGFNTSGAQGSFPSGGGGSSASTTTSHTSGAGAAGRVRVYAW